MGPIANRNYISPVKQGQIDAKLNFCHNNGANARLCIFCLKILDYQYSFWFKCRGCGRWWARY